MTYQVQIYWDVSDCPINIYYRSSVVVYTIYISPPAMILALSPYYGYVLIAAACIAL